MPFQSTILAGPYTPADAVTLSAQDMLPRGSACLTTSGQLAAKGMAAILQAATGSMTPRGGIYEPTLQSVKDSIENGFKLLSANGFTRMAVPFIGGNIFRGRIGVSKQVLAEAIVDSCLAQYAAHTVLIGNDNEVTKLFRDAVEKNWPAVDPQTVVKHCGILSFHDHQAPVIMNAANMEVTFGGGLSGIIGSATGDQTGIDQEAKADIQAFWKSVQQTTAAAGA